MFCCNSIQVLYINLARSQDRRLYIESEISGAWSHVWKRVIATDGAKMDIDRLRGSGLVAENITLGRLLRAGEVGAWISHYRAWRNTLSSTCSGSLIIEDDVKLAKALQSTLESRLGDLDLSGEPWHISFLGCLEGVASWSPRLNGSPRLPGGFVRLNSGNGGCPGAYGYLINREGAEIMVAIARRLKIDRPVDELFRLAFESGQIKALCASPPLILHGRSAVGKAFPSTILEF